MKHNFRKRGKEKVGGNIQFQLTGCNNLENARNHLVAHVVYGRAGQGSEIQVRDGSIPETMEPLQLQSRSDNLIGK